MSISHLPDAIKYKDLDIITTETTPSQISAPKETPSENIVTLEGEFNNIFLKKGEDIFRTYRTIKSFSNWGDDTQLELIDKIFQIYKEDLTSKRIPNSEILNNLEILENIFSALKSLHKLSKINKINLPKEKFNAILAAYIVKNI